MSDVSPQASRSPSTGPRRWIRDLLRSLVVASASDIPEEARARPAVVFAPHPDDETLGCGGTILSKRDAGGAVQVVFLTDGAGSHARYMPEEKLRIAREAEGIAACRRLGVPERGVRFLGYPDGELERHRDRAVPDVATILESERPEQIFVPCRRETPPDHSAARDIVLAASRQALPGVTVFEYPIWVWNTWPWTALRKRGVRWRLGQLRNSARVNLDLVREFRCRVNVSDHLQAKREALSEHRSQMTRPASVPGWPILADVANGDFLECFFGDWEIFHVYRLR